MVDISKLTTSEMFNLAIDPDTSIELLEQLCTCGHPTIENRAYTNRSYQKGWSTNQPDDQPDA